MEPTTDAAATKQGDCGCDCTKALENLYVFLDQEIDTASCAEIQQHIEECASCLSEFDVERVVKSLVQKSCAERAPETLHERIQFAIRTVEVRLEG